MSTEELKVIARSFVERVFNDRDLGALGEMAACDAADQLKSSLALCLVLSAFPDLHASVEQLIAEGDRVTVLSTFSGTHLGEFMGIRGTGRGVKGMMSHVLTIADGEIVAAWQNLEPWCLVSQLGACRMPAAQYGGDTGTAADTRVLAHAGPA